MARVNARREDRGQKTLDPGQVDAAYLERYLEATNQFRERQDSWNQSFAGQKQLGRIQESLPSSLDLKVPEFKFESSYIPGQYSSSSNNPSVGMPKVNPSSLIVGGPEVKPIDPQSDKSIASFNATVSKINPAQEVKPNLASKQVSPIKMFPDSLPSAPKENPLSALSPTKMKKNYT